MKRYLVKFKDPNSTKTEEFEVDEFDTDEAIKKAKRIYKPSGAIYGVSEIPVVEDLNAEA